MNSHLVAFIFGIPVGIVIGWFGLGLCVAAKRGDNGTWFEGLLRAIRRHAAAAPSCACSVCTYWRGDVAEGPQSEVNLAETDAWRMAGSE